MTAVRTAAKDAFGYWRNSEKVRAANLFADIAILYRSYYFFIAQDGRSVQRAAQMHFADFLTLEEKKEFRELTLAAIVKYDPLFRENGSTASAALGEVRERYLRLLDTWLAL